MIIHLFCLILMLTPTLIQAAPPRPDAFTAPPPAGARNDTLFLFAAEGPGSFGSPGTDARGFTFDGPGGEAAKAGWFGVDLNAQELHWQLADTDLCAGTGTDMSQALPFDPEDTINDHALWCGSLDNCDWIDPDGYGNGWDQYVVLDLGPQFVGDSVIVSFAYRTDFEGGEYDNLELFSFVDNYWEDHWIDYRQGDRTYREAEVAIPAWAIDPDSLRLGFRFHSDGGWSDQDGRFPSDLGAVWLDNIRVHINEREIFAADFEDGLLPQEMHFYLPESAGDYAQLYDGLYQGEADPVNESFVWGFGYWESRNQAPYFDNIRVMLVEGDLTAASSTPPAPFLSAHPNPFNPCTELSLYLPEAGRLRLTLHDIGGRRVATLVDEILPAGARRLSWDGRGDDGRVLPSGIYLARAATAECETTLKLMLLK